MTTTQPNYNANGHQVWNPEVGIYAKGAFGVAESYGGIVGALQDLAVESGARSKAYPHNFAGIIAAIQDLSIASDNPPVKPGPNPGGGALPDPDADTDEDWQEVIPPREGDLWFDTRQGRLFVYVNSEWIQTNGADGLAAITENATPPSLEDGELPAPGQLWYNSSDNDLYIHDGTYQGDSPVWRLVNTDPNSLIQTTATLPLAGTGPREAISTRAGDVITAPDLLNFNTQQDYNWWAFQAIVELEEEIVNKSDVIIGDTPPTDPDVLKPGILWYDTESLDLSIYYDDGDSTQWVPVSTPYTYDEDLDLIRASISNERSERTSAISQLRQEIENQDISSNSVIRDLNENHSALAHLIASVGAGNYQTSITIQSALDELENKIDSINIPAPVNLAPYAKSVDLQQVQQGINQAISQLPTVDHLNEVRNLIPSVAEFVKQSDIDTSIGNITTNFLPRNGGILNGSFVINKTQQDSPAFDFSSSSLSSNPAFKFQCFAPGGDNVSSFGSTLKPWELAWNFSNEEDFCWIYNDTNKVFSITKEGPACSQLYLADFEQNTNNGRVIANRIDVRQRLTDYKTAFEQIRSAVNSSTDFESLKAGLLTALANV